MAILFLQGTTKSWSGFVGNTEARLAPVGVQLYSGVVYSSKDDLHKLLTTPNSRGEKSQSQHCQTLSQNIGVEVK
jgi:hypothetical protein